MLILDKSLSPPERLASVAQPWMQAGAQVEYRRFFPYLVASDTTAYDILLICSGRRPLYADAPLTRQEVDLLRAFLERGGAVVLAYDIHPSGRGAADRAAMNQLLKESAMRVRIGEVSLRDSLHTYLTLTGRGLLVRSAPTWRQAPAIRLPVNRAAPLKILKDARAEVAAASFPGGYFLKKENPYSSAFPVIAMAKNGGTVLVVPRAFLELTAQPQPQSPFPVFRPQLADSAAAFLTALAGRFLQVVEGAALDLTPSATYSAIPVHAEARLPQFPLLKAVPYHPPLPVQTVRFDRTWLPEPALMQLQQRLYLERLQNAFAPLPFLQTGLHALAGRLAPAADEDGPTAQQMQRLVAFQRQAGIPLFFGDASPTLLFRADSASPGLQKQVEHSWRELLKQLAAEKQALLWLPALSWDELADFRPRVTARDGRSLALPSAINLQLWWQGVISPLRRAAHLLRAYTPYFAGIGIHLDFNRPNTPETYQMGQDFSDGAFRFFLVSAADLLTAAELRRAQRLDPAERFDFLVETGLLRFYYFVLESEIEKQARILRRQVEMESPNRLWAVRVSELPADWFVRGLIRGLSAPEQPVLLLTHAPQARRYLSRLREQDIFALHLLAVYPSRFTENQVQRLLQLAKAEHQGFWLPAQVALDSADRLPGGIRRDALIRLLSSATKSKARR